MRKRCNRVCVVAKGDQRATKSDKAGVIWTFGLWIFLFFAATTLIGNTYTVTNTNDTGPGSLRDAINLANGHYNARDTIQFNIPGAGPHTIHPLSQLPQLIDPAGVFIDGLSQAGATTGNNPPSTAILMIEVNGANAGASHGFYILSPNNTIQGLVIDSFQQDGIRIEGTEAGTHNNLIYSNFIGTDISGCNVSGNGWNQNGLWAGVNIVVPPCAYPIFAFNNMVLRNLISGNYAEGVSISSCPPGDNYCNGVRSNYIGTDITGMLDRGNLHDGVYIGEGAHDNVVDSNVVSGNDFEGVCIVGYAEATPPVTTYNNWISSNLIGLTVNQTPLPNTGDGVSIGIYGTPLSPPFYKGGYATDNMVNLNVIAYNGRNGVMVWEHMSSSTNADRNQITQNSIYDNTLLGIDLDNDGVTPNDGADPDNRANQALNFPIIVGASYNPVTGSTSVSGYIDIDTDPTQAVVEVFKARIDPTGYGEGQVFLGTATPDAGGNWYVTVTGLVTGDTVTSTTTDLNRNTSEFSGNMLVTQATGVSDGDINTPSRFTLCGNFPNPFSSYTLIRYSIAKTTGVSLRVYDASGKLVRTLVDEIKKPAWYTVKWDGRDNSGRKVSSGVYFYRLKTRNFDRTRELILIR